MDEKAELKLARKELAAHLEALAKGLKQGKLEVEGHTWSVPEEVSTKLHLKEKKGRLVLKVKCVFETLGEYELAAREPVARWQESFKTVKKRLAAHFKELQRVVLQGQLPDRQLLADFAADSRALADMSEPDWKEAIQAYMDHVAALERAVAGQDLESVRHEVADLRTAMATCHQEFK